MSMVHQSLSSPYIPLQKLPTLFLLHGSILPLPFIDWYHYHGKNELQYLLSGYQGTPSFTRQLATFWSMHPCSNNAIVTSHNRPHIEALWSVPFCCDNAIVTSHNGLHIKTLWSMPFFCMMPLSQVTTGHPSKPFNLQVPTFPLIIIPPLLVM